MPGPGKVKQTFIAACLTLIVFSGAAQSLKDHLVKGDRYYIKKDYQNALKSYLDALALDASDPHTNFKAGVSYLNVENFSHAVTYLEKAYSLNEEVDPDISYHLGMALQKDHQYAKARKHFESFKVRNKKLSGVASQKIMECSVGDSLMRIPANAEIEALPSGINSAFADVSPLITRDGKTLIFTSNRSTDEYQVKSATNFEDVYISQKEGNQWSAPQKISQHINVRLNEAAVSIAADGKTLFLRYEEGGGDIYTSKLENDEWTKPAPLNRFINHPDYRESTASLSPDGRKLYFASNRPGGKGGFDIYVCELGSNGQWGRAANLGSTINTRLNEESPFLHADGVSLYFSSNGHATLGNNDIFKSSLKNNKWTSPENLGYPVNTSGYDGYFILSDDKTVGYFSSRRGKTTGTDIYTATFRSVTRAAETGSATMSAGTVVQSGTKIVTLLKGTVIDVSTDSPLAATIILVDNSNKNVVSKITTTPSGNFELVIPHGGNYGVTTERQGYLFNSMNFNLPTFEKYQEIDTRILMVKAEVGSKVVLKNIFFDLNQSGVKKESLSELENIRDLLLQNPAWRIQINGYTDNTGDPASNLDLSSKRAESVVQYLISQGIARSRVQARGYGSERPLVSNDDETEGRQINRRTEIEIIE